ncbi:hypothetical protein TBLA_0C02100 [Henningerozyma blattae CBS 6284]|uniref:Inositol hexakisphosphate and diphosphoinositol-pentakisphosphate kinase n=1 Tax=Henningerozyma blattae (strain ATCC 34711 / CBS 6284 / DSM 70876 / NBRC 10599 / NRRL Y-10934 / UCD 77-7) TaxID=1071380 RepID=I2H0X0_HENB6|nr:hypothetical protein TBLA_0C02100 [Tetrapisispora blattae CBS 6284]CCH60022.1 hypothetical protein TBLA_0C02100 [Tetrapisispora blattae CBS 6284]
MQEKNLPKEGEILPSLNDKRPGSEKDLKYLDTPINSDPLKKTKAETRSGTAKTIESFAPILEAFSPTPSHSENTSLKLGTPGSPRIDTLNEEEALTNLLNVGLQLNDKNQRSSHNSVTDPSSSANSVNFSDNFDRPDMNSGLGISSTAFDSLPPSIIKDESPVPHAKSTSPSTSSSRKSSLSHHKVQLPRVGKIGVCAMDAKVLSKPCTQILNRLQENGQFTTIIFGDKVILDEKVENWPTCDFLISFFSKGFPLEKAIRYVNLRKPFMINDLVMQKALWDRRLCLQILQAANIPTPRRLMIIRDGGPKVDKQLKEKLSKAGVEVDKMVESRWKMIDDDTLEVDGHIMRKPFVEKPVDGEDHNIFIYYHSKNGGGGRRLFRKVGNKSSEFDPSLITPRRQGSYIYEEFMDTDNLEDVKAYTVGEGFCHAETRKSPVVDGIVRRNIHGKEVRYITELTDEEKEIARKVSTAFSQMICGFDLLRVKGKSYVIDVNGFSFVKDNTSYYDSCAQILRDTFIKAKKEIDKKKQILPIIKEEKMQNWVFKGLVSIIRHADRTPKQKIKYSFTTPIFIALLKGHKEEVIIRAQTDMEIVLQALSFAREENKEDPAKLKVLYTALKKKLTFRGTKIQLKPVINKDNEVEKVQFILKWGGEPTHSAPYQAQDLGEEMRQYFDLLNKDTLQDVTIYSSSERRVVLTAQTWANALFGEDEISSDVINIRKDLLDDSNAAKELMDKVKKRLKPLLRQHKKPSRNFSWPPEMPEPYTVVKRVVELMNFHKKVLRYNFANEDIENIQARWCCGEDPALFKERWEKLFKEFTSVEKLDPSKISELYDSMKYDALHNREFLQLVFNPNNCQDVKEEIEKHASLVDRYPINILAMNNFKISNNLKTDDADAQNTSSVGSLGWSLEGKTMKNPNAIPDSPFNDPSFIQFRELFKLTKVLFDFISPQEYGIEDTEKLDIGLLTSLPLAKQILNDLKDLKEKTSPGCVAYFTKESHIYTLLNIIYESGIPMKIVRSALPEFDYLSQINFELYESTDPMGHKTHAIRLKMSPGCHTQDPLDVQIDEKHYISCIPKISLTKHLDMDYCQQKLRNKFPRVNLPPKFIPVSITNPNLIFKKEIQAKMEKEEKCIYLHYQKRKISL